MRRQTVELSLKGSAVQAEDVLVEVERCSHIVSAESKVVHPPSW